MQYTLQVSFIILNYNGVEDTLLLIDSIYSNIKSVTYEIIVVDNCSLNDDQTQIRKAFPNIVLINNSVNLGFAGGNNIGIKKAKGEYIFVINNDTYFEKDNIINMINCFTENKNVGAVCPKILFHNPKGYIQFVHYTELSKITLRNKLIDYMLPDNNNHNGREISPYMHGAAVMVSQETIKKAGLIPEIYFLYYEELDWSELIKKAGLTIWYEPSVTIYHKESQSLGGYTPMRTYYLTRNRLKFTLRNRQGINKVLSLLYQLFISIPKGILLASVKCNLPQIKAITIGVFDFLFRPSLKQKIKI
ncbi:MAG: glycosyltransferase family 2 protein [Muribaculaceae bacterium]|nr:glycosyltransferase family 2 protein [Muribaculaceae bacterium]